MNKKVQVKGAYVESHGPIYPVVCVIAALALFGGFTLIMQLLFSMPG